MLCAVEQEIAQESQTIKDMVEDTVSTFYKYSIMLHGSNTAKRHLLDIYSMTVLLAGRREPHPFAQRVWPHPGQGHRVLPIPCGGCQEG